MSSGSDLSPVPILLIALTVTAETPQAATAWVALQVPLTMNSFFVTPDTDTI